MRHWLSAHRKALRQALARLFVSPPTMLLSVLGIGIALALPAGGYQMLDPVAALGRGAAATPQLTVFLAVEADRATALAIEKRLRDRGDIAQTRFLAREDTLARMQQDTALADVIGALPQNPFPDAIVVSPADDSAADSLAALEQIAVAARQWRGVELVQIDSDWAQRLAAFVRLARTGLLLLAVLLGLGLIAITFNTIRLQVLTRQAEIDVSRLLGATDAFIRRPFLWHGALLGLLGGGVAWLIVAGALLWLQAPVAELAALYGLRIELAPPGARPSTLLLGSAVGLGWCGAALSIRQHLSE